jgi:outer membrane immunogenic protein
MKRILLSGVAAVILMGGQAMAADLSVRGRAPVYKAPPMVAAYNWSGCYIGAHIGGGWGTKDWDEVFTGSTSENAGSHDIDGILGGGQIGCNIQNGTWVFGLEGDISWSGIDGSHSAFGGDADLSSKVEWLGTVTGRIGYAHDRFLFYVKGGAAFAHDQFTVAFGDSSTDDQTRWGWTIGGGLEFALVGNWTAKLEYNYMDFGSDTASFFGGEERFDIDQQIHVVKFGLNYRFGGSDAIVARY